MLSYIEYLGMPITVGVVIAIVFFGIQAIGELLEFKGKVVPEFAKIRKYFARKKKEREALSKITEFLDERQEMIEERQEMKKTITEVKRVLDDIDKHYSKDNIAMRDGWMKEVNEHIIDSEKIRAEQDSLMRALNEKLDRNNEDTLSLLIDSKRNTIIDFASKVIDDNYPVTREQFKRIFKIHEEYEVIIEKNNLTNGEVDIAYKIIEESYENHLRNHSFVEDVRGYNI